MRKPITKLQKQRKLSNLKKKVVAKKSLTLESKAKELKVKKKLLKEQVELKKEISKYTKLLKEASNGTGVDKIYELVDEIGTSKETVIDAYYAYAGNDDIGKFLESLDNDYDVDVDVDDAVEILGEDTVFTELVNWMSTDEILEFLESEFDMGGDDSEPTKYGVLIRDMSTAIPHLLAYEELSEARIAMNLYENIEDAQRDPEIAQEMSEDLEDYFSELPYVEDDIEMGRRDLNSIDDSIYEYFDDYIKVLNEDSVFDIYL